MGDVLKINICTDRTLKNLCDFQLPKEKKHCSEKSPFHYHWEEMGGLLVALIATVKMAMEVQSLPVGWKILQWANCI